MLEPITPPPTPLPALAEPTKARAEAPLALPPIAEHAAVLAEMEKLQNRQTGWVSGILILAVSLLVFVGAGSWRWDWEFVLMLIPILLFHELGHYVAMRVFRYRNVRMFFIPFFGAAVSGQNYNVSGWKKVMVALAGPLPGIVAGVVLGIVGLYTKNDLLNEVALVTLFINAFNLLPVFPLDGGQVMHALLFSRHYLLDTGFRVAAAAALLAGSAFLDDRLLLWLGIFMLLGVWSSYQLARVTHDLRGQGLRPVSPDNQTVPPDVADRIIARLKAAFPRGTGNKALAQYALQVFESLNARPPGWGATVGLGALHAGAFVVALAFGALFVLAQRGDIGNTVAMAITRPQRSLAVEELASWQGRDIASAIAQPRSTIVAQFSDDDDAARVFDSIQPRLPATAAAALFGNAILLALPTADNEARKVWFNELESHTTNVYVDATYGSTRSRIYCVAPDSQVATRISQECAAYFAIGADAYLIPPWMPPAEDERSPEEIARHRLARETYRKLIENENVAMSVPDPAIEELVRKMNEAVRRADLEQQEMLMAEQEKHLAEQRASRLAVFLAVSNDQIDREVVQLYASLFERQGSSDEDDSEAGVTRYRETYRKLGERMGQLPLINDEPSPQHNRYSARGGNVLQEGSILNYDSLFFTSLIDGAPTLVDWLNAQGCTEFHYEIDGRPFSAEDLLAD